MTSERESTTTKLNGLYDLFWQSSSALDKAFMRAKIGMVSAELARIEMADPSIPLKDPFGMMKL